MGLLKRLFSSGATRRVTLTNPLVISSPRICFFNMIGVAADTIVKEDQASFSTLFNVVDQCDGDPPLCDVLMIYGQLDGDGKFANRADGLREIIERSKAPIVIVSSENSGESYIAAGKKKKYGQANLIMTLDRKGDAFCRFFVQLFSKMFEGKSMLLAWVELAPQIPNSTHDDCPGTIFSAEVSHIIFEKG